MFVFMCVFLMNICEIFYYHKNASNFASFDT